MIDITTKDKRKEMLRALFEAYSEATSRYTEAVREEQRLITALRSTQRKITAAADTCDRLYLKWAEAKERTPDGQS